MSKMKPKQDRHASDGLIKSLMADTESLLHAVDESKVMRMGQSRRMPHVFGDDAPPLLLPALLCGKEVEAFIATLDERDALAALEEGKG